jgi:hypothetical protein
VDVPFVDRNQLVILASGSVVNAAGTLDRLVLDSSVAARNTQVEPVVPGGAEVYHPTRGMYVVLLDTAYANEGSRTIPIGSTVYVLPESLISPVSKRQTGTEGKDALVTVAAREQRSSGLAVGLLAGLAAAIVVVRFA